MTPVVGIILVVAITIVLAAVVGTFVINTGNERTTVTPQVSFSFTYDDTDSTLNATHEGGDPIENPSARLSVKGDEVDSENPLLHLGGDSELNSGDTIEIELSNPLSSGDEVKIVWSDAESDTTSVVARYEFGA